ncbi:MAG: carboxy terminal-processing peptidase, partial [Bacteroidota bacterium]
TDMEKFMSMLSVEGYFFGVKFDENDEGHIIVATLVPGSPAWKSGEFHAGDVLISLKWDGHDAVDIHGITLEETDEILEDANHGTLEFTIRKADGLQKTVRLRKEKISLEENFVRSFVLSGAKKIGYISLPDFYTRWGDQTEGARCANDVAKEILKLKKEGIEGLILDIRYNGGGSLWEAMAMAGIFIDEGSLGLIKDKNQAVTILKDINRGTVYDGPLVILVNGHSASASEFLAGAIQDYHRGIIVGSRTFGKATAQEIFPLGQYAATKNIQEAIRQGSGFASITIGRFYRVTGRSTQGKGLVPDIALPDVFEALDYHEEKLPFAFGPDSVSKKTYFKPLAKLPIEEMRRRSAERVDASASFQKLKNIYRWVSEEINEVKEPVLLLWQEFYKTHQEDILQRKALTELSSKPTTLYTVVNNESNQERMMTDEYSVEFIEHWKKKLLHDLYLEEAYAIACDYLTINKP